MVAAVDERYRQLVDLVRRTKQPGLPATLLVTDRAARLPGLLALLADLPDVDTVALEPDAAARGALRRRESIEAPGEALPFVTRLPADRTPPRVVLPMAVASPVPGGQVGAGEAPTHVVHDGNAYRIDERPLLLGLAIPEGQRGVRLRGSTAGVSRSHCTLLRNGSAVLLEDHSSHGTFVNGARVTGRVAVHAGDRLRIGSPGVELHLIAVEEGST
jgi:hypothetical protein